MRGAPPQPQDKGKGRDFFAFALWYAKLGFRVIPLRERDKRPLIPNWQNEATTDEATIREWWAKWPNANIGIATGRYRDGYFCVLDFDPRNGGDWYGDVGAETLPPTWVVHTGGGGRHYYYRTRELLRGAKLEAGVDLKGDGGYVVAPPSIHPEGEPYVWEVGSAPSECPLAPLPGWVEPIAAQDEKKHYTMAPPIPEGYRYHYAVSLMGLLLAKGADIDKVTEFILANREWLFEHGQRPFTEREIRAVGRWLSKKAPGRPVKRWRPVLEKAGVAKQVIEAWASYIGEPDEPPEPDLAKGGKMTRAKIAKLLEAAEWVKFRGDLWLTHKGQLYALSEAHEYVYDVSGRTASQQTAKEVAMAMRRQNAQTAKPIDRAVVLYDEAPIFGRAAGFEGVWFAAEDRIWVVTKDGSHTWPITDPPDGVYYRPDRVLPRTPVLGPEGVKELRTYWWRLTRNLEEGEKGPELSLAALAPVLLGLCPLGVFFTGEKGSGKSTAARAALQIVYGREPITGMGDTNRDRLSVADADRIFYADDIDITDAEMQKLMRVGLTGGQVRVRKLYEDKKTEVMAIDGSYFLCGIEAKGLRADTLERFISLRFSPKVRIPEAKVAAYFAENWHKALGGLLTLYQRAASLPEPDLSAWGWVRMQDWLSWAFRFAEVLKVGEEFRKWVLKVRGAAMVQAKFGELAEAIVAGRIKEGVAYKARTLAEILWPDLAMGGEKGKQGQNTLGAENALYRKERAISSPAGRKALADIAQSCGLRIRMQKVGGADGYWEYVFEKAVFEQGWEVPENTLEALYDGAHSHTEGVWEAPATPLPQNGHAPMPEVHSPPPVPQIALTDLPASLSEGKKAVQKAPPAPEPERVAPQSEPADVGEGAPMAPPYAGTLTPAMQAYLRASDELTNLLTHPELRIVEPKEPELLLIIVETIKGVKKLRELFPILREKDGDNIDALTLGYRTLYACMWGHMSILCGLATFRGLSLEGELPHPKVGWAVVRRVLQEVEGVLKGEEVTLWPLPELRKAPTDPEPTPPPIEPEPKWREAGELFAQIPPGHPARLAILKGLAPDPLLDWEYHTKHRLIRALLNGEAIDPPSKPPENP